MDPLPPLAPTEYSQCSTLEREWGRLEEEVSRRHQDCLDAHQKSKEQKNPDSGSGPGSRCTYPGCQALHNRLFEIGARKAPAVDECRASVEKHKEDEHRRQEAEERQKREREEEERKRQEKEDERKRDAEAHESKERSDREDAERRHQETNRKLVEMAADQQRREQEALAQRTEARRQQMEELKNKEEGVNERYEHRVGEETRDAQKSLMDQLARNAGSENAVFPPSGQEEARGDEFDLSSVPTAAGRGGAEAHGDALPELSPEYENAAAPEAGTPFADIYGKVKDTLSSLARQGREYMQERLREHIDENVKEIGNTMLAGALGGEDEAKTARDMMKRYYDDSYKDPLREMVGGAYAKAVNGPVQEATDGLAKAISEHLRDGSGPLRGDGLVGALRDAGVKAGAEKLSEHLKQTFVEEMTTKVTEVYHGLSDRLVGPSDHVTQPVQDTALLRLPALITKAGSPAAAAKAIYDYGLHMVNAMGEMFDRLLKSDFYGTAPPDNTQDNR